MMTRKPQPAFEPSRGHWMVLLLFLLAFLSALPNIRYFELTLEEPTRAVIAYEIALKVGDDRKIAFRCRDFALAYHVDTQARARVVSESKLKDWHYLISCEGPVEARLLAEFKARRYPVLLHARR